MRTTVRKNERPCQNDDYSDWTTRAPEDPGRLLRRRAAGLAPTAASVDLEHQLAEVGAGKQHQQTLRERVEPFDDILSRLEPAGSHPSGDLAHRIGVPAGVVEHHHAFHA